MFSIGDKVSVKRGRDAGPAEIIAPADADGNYVIKTQEGKHRVVKAESLKAPEQSMVSEGRLAAEIQTAANDAGAGDNIVQNILKALVGRLAADAPGLGARIAWPAESAER